MNNLSDAVDAFITVAGLAGMGLILAAIVYYVHCLKRCVSMAWAQRDAWVRSHFPEPKYTSEDVDTPQFVAALLENTEDAAVWQYYDEFDEARKVEGGYDKLCSLDCCAKEDSSPGLLFIVTGNKVKIALYPYEVRALLRRVLQHRKVRCWIQEQSQYAGFSWKAVPLKDMNTVLNAPGVSLWKYVSAWENVVLIPPEKYETLDMNHCNSINCITFDTLFAIDMKNKCIYQPFLEEVIEYGKSRTHPLTFI